MKAAFYRACSEGLCATFLLKLQFSVQLKFDVYAHKNTFLINCNSLSS
jgi:hypothetical protein